MRHVHAHMARVLLQHPDLLTSHRDDFDRLDFNELVLWGAPAARYLWLARPSGSDLALLDVHARVAERCRTILDLKGGSTKAFLVTEQVTSEVDQATAAQLLAGGRFSLTGSRITCDGVPLASVRVIKSLGYGRNPSASVLFKSERILTSFDVVALRQLAHVLVAEELDLFAAVDAIKIDGRELAAARMDALRRERVLS